MGGVPWVGVPGEMKFPHLLTPLQLLSVCELVSASSCEAQIQSENQLFLFMRPGPLDPVEVTSLRLDIPNTAGPLSE